MRLRVHALFLALAAGCAGVGAAPGSGARRGLRAESAVELGAAEAGTFVARAVSVLRDRALEVAACDDTRVVTAPREVEVPCGAGACLARELVVARVEGRRARVELLRATWDTGLREWRMALPAPAAVATAQEEAGLLQAILRAEPAAGCPEERPALSLAPR